jgi:hypothetical protein
MKDSDFKKLKHYAKGYMTYSDGNKIENNFCPDYVLQKGNEFILIEHETVPNRKTVLADMVKAAHFLQENKTGILVIVMTPKRKSSLESYSKYIEQYFEWVKGITNLNEIYFIHESAYQQNEIVLEIKSTMFNDLSTKIVNAS